MLRAVSPSALERGGYVLVDHTLVVACEACSFQNCIQLVFPEVTAGQEFDSCPQDSFRKRLHRFKGEGAKLFLSLLALLEF